MLLLIFVIGGVAIFCFSQGYVAIGIVALAGFSKKFGWPALAITSVYLFARGHWIAAALPLLLIGWNIVGLRVLKKIK